MAGRRCCDDNRIDVRQGILDVGVCGNAVIGLRMAVTDLGEPLVYANDRRYPGRGSQHADVPRTPVTYADDADPDSPRSRPHIQLPACLGPAASASFWELLPMLSAASPIADWNGTPA